MISAHITRLLQQADSRAALVAIHTAFSAQSMPTDPPSSALRETQETIAAQIAAGGGACVEGGPQSMAGVVLWAETGRGLYIGRLAVVPAWRGRGVARALVAAAERQARRRGAGHIHLSVRLSLADNRRLFASCGFIETVRSCHPGYAEPTSVAMEKRLP